MKTPNKIREILIDIMTGSCDGLAEQINWDGTTELTDYEMIDAILDSYCEDLVFWQYGLEPEDLRNIFIENYHSKNGMYSGVMGMTSIDATGNCTYMDIDEIIEQFKDGYDFYVKNFKRW